MAQPYRRSCRGSCHHFRNIQETLNPQSLRFLISFQLSIGILDSDKLYSGGRRPRASTLCFDLPWHTCTRDVDLVDYAVVFGRHRMECWDFPLWRLALFYTARSRGGCLWSSLSSLGRSEPWPYVPLKTCVLFGGVRVWTQVNSKVLNEKYSRGNF